MGMVVSAAVTGIPVIEELENERTNIRKPAGGKQGTKKGNSSVPTGANPKQSKGKQKENAPPNTKGGASKENKAVGSKSGASAQIKGRNAPKEEAKSAREKSNTAKAGPKGTSKAEKGTSSLSTGLNRGKR